MIRLADALLVSATRHNPIAGLSRLIVDAPEASNGAESLRISPWTAEDLRAPLRLLTVTDLVAYATETNEWTLSVSLDDSLGAQDQDTRHVEGVAYHHDHTKSQGKKKPYSTNGPVHRAVRLQLGTRSYAYDWRLDLREKTGRRLNRLRLPEPRRHFRKKTSLARDMLEGFQQLFPAGFQVYVLFDSWDAAHDLLKFCRRQGWHGMCAIKSHRKFDAKKRSPWPPALRHPRSQRVQLTAPDQRSRPSLVRTRRGKLSPLPCEVCVLISQRHHRDQHPKYFLCTALALTAPQILPIYQKRWPIEVDHFSVKQHWGLADFRGQSYEATEKWLAIVFLA